MPITVLVNLFDDAELAIFSNVAKADFKHVCNNVLGF